MTDNLSLAVHAFDSRVLMSVSIVETLLPISYPARTITDADNTDDIALLANAPAQAETLQHSLVRAAAGIGLHVNAHKMEYMCFNQSSNIFTLNGSTLKLVDKFMYIYIYIYIYINVCIHVACDQHLFYPTCLQRVGCDNKVNFFAEFEFRVL